MTIQIRNPVEWTVDQLKVAGHTMEQTARYVVGPDEARDSLPPVVRRIKVADLKEVVVSGLSDFAACRTDVVLVCLIYPILGLVLARLVFGYDMLPLLFPLASASPCSARSPRSASTK